MPPINAQTSRPKIAGMSLVAEHPHNKYGSAILIREDMKVENVYERGQGTVELITIIMSGVVHSVYKLPNDQFSLPALGHRDLPHIVIGDFNIHSTSWGYDTTNNNGEAVEQWHIHLTSHPSIMLNYRNPSTLQAGRKATTQISSLHLEVSQTCE